MKIYMIMEGCVPFSTLTYMGAFKTKEAALKAIEIKGKKDPEWLKELRPSIEEVELH